MQIAEYPYAFCVIRSIFEAIQAIDRIMWIKTNNRLPDINQAVIGNIDNNFIELRYMPNEDFVRLGFAELGRVEPSEWMPIMYEGSKYAVNYLFDRERFEEKAIYREVKEGYLMLEETNGDQLMLLPHQLIEIVAL